MPATNVNWPVPLTRLNPWYPGQCGGVPGTDSETGLRLNTGGAIFWVDPNHVDNADGRDGTNPTAPLSTVGAAIAKCEPYRGDVIAVMHNGDWTYGDLTSDNITPVQETVTIDVPGVRLVGVSTSPLGVPWIPTANNDVLITVHALDVIVEGFNFWDGSLYTGVTGILTEWDSPDYYGENLVVRHCYFYDIAYGISLDYAWNCEIDDCQFYNMATAAIHNPSVYGEPDYLAIRDCVFRDNADDINLPDCDEVLIDNNRFMAVTAAIVITNGDNNQIVGNVIEGAGAGVNNMINLTGGASNVVTGNTLTCSIAQYDTTCSDATSGAWGFNHCTNGNTSAAPT